jgi:hypothetical protein
MRDERFIHRRVLRKPGAASIAAIATVPLWKPLANLAAFALSGK